MFWESDVPIVFVSLGGGTAIDRDGTGHVADSTLIERPLSERVTQQWTFRTPPPGNVSYVVAAEDGHLTQPACLDLSLPSADGERSLCLRRLLGTDTQWFYFEQNWDDSWTIRSYATGQVVSGARGEVGGGVPVDLADDYRLTHQRWHIRPVGTRRRGERQ